MSDFEFYLASTPLNIFLCSSIASHRKHKKSILLFIDQREIDENFYFDQLTEWKDSPFQDVYIFPGHVKGFLNKKRSRQKIFSTLNDLIEKYHPSEIYTGNDRRVEFQYSMQKSLEYGGASGNYIDDGIFTYLGRPDSAINIQDTVIDTCIKKLTYGFWWQTPPTIGGSNWIKNVYAAFPQLVHPLLSKKNVIELNAHWLQSDNLNKFSAQLLRAKNIEPEIIQSVDVLIALPHESIISQSNNYKESIIKLISQLKTQNKNIAVKYHPRDQVEDSLHLKEIGCTLIPSQVNFEALLLIFPTNKTIIGDFSSVLLNARWLRPDLRVIAALENEESLPSNMLSLYSSLQIEMVSVNSLQNL